MKRYLLPISLMPSFDRPAARPPHEIAEAVAANDRLQRHLDGEVEVIRQQGLNRVDDLAAVGLEGVGRVVVVVPEDRPDEPVREPVDRQLQPGVVVHPGAANES
jgi:hypothetical protein